MSERGGAEDAHYPHNTLYISELAVTEAYRRKGIARALIRMVMENVTTFSHLSGPLVFAVQTNAAEWNAPVIALYRSMGFTPRGFKDYDNRRDVILMRDAFCRDLL